MRRVERMMRQRRQGIVPRRGAMHERDRPQRRLPCRRPCQREARAGAEWHPPDGCELHEEVMWMLMIDERLTFERLTDLKDFAISPFVERRRVQAEHGVKRQLGRSDLAAEHPHPPVGSLEFG